MAFTRAQLTKALTEADRPDLAQQMYSRRLSVWEQRSVGARSALAFDYEMVGDALSFLTIVQRTLLSEDDAIAFAAAAEVTAPGHRPLTAISGLYWPGWVLDEPTAEEWADIVNACPTCTALDDAGPCPEHALAPWLPPQED